jgi:hypothetical protein
MLSILAALFDSLAARPHFTQSLSCGFKLLSLAFGKLFLGHCDLSALARRDRLEESLDGFGRRAALGLASEKVFQLDAVDAFRGVAHQRGDSRLRSTATPWKEPNGIAKSIKRFRLDVDHNSLSIDRSMQFT